MVDAKEEDYDAIGIAEDALEASVQVFLVRKGRVVGRKGLIVDKVEDLDAPELVGRLLEQLYGDARRRPTSRARCSCPIEPDDVRALRGVPRRRCAAQQVAHPGAAARREARAARRPSTQNARGGVRPPQAASRASDHNARARALLALQEALAPARGAAAHRVLRHLQPAGHRDRRVDGGDGRRPAEALRLPAVQDPPPAGPGRLRGDGGGAHPPVPPLPRRARRGRAGGQAVRVPAEPAARRRRQGPARRSRCACSRISASRTSAWRAWPSASKRSTCQGEPDPVRIPRDSEALYLLQQVRDEAHRFAITYHRQLRDKKMTKSVLDDVPGLGPGAAAPPAQGVRIGEAAARADREELVAIPWLPEPVGARRARRSSTAETVRRRADDDARRHRHHRHVGRRALGGRRRARGPRLLRDRQPAAGAHRQGRRARPRGRERAAAVRAGRRRALRASSSTISSAALAELRERWRRDAGPVPRRRPTTCSSAATRPPAASTRSRPTTGSPRASRTSGAARGAEGPRPTSCVDTSDLNVHELRDRLSSSSPRTPHRRRCRPTSCRSATSTACRSTSTSCSTAGSSRTRTGSTSFVRSRAPTPGARLRAGPARDPGVPRRARAAVRADAARVRARGQVVPVDRDRLHRRPPPQRRDRDRARAICSCARLSRRSVHHRDVDRD